MLSFNSFRQWFAVLAVALLGLTFDPLPAEAKRLGGGFSFGKQSSNVTQRQAAPREAPTATNSRQQQAAPAAAGQRSRMGGMLAGLAAGLGLAWLASALGLGEEFATLLLFALIAVAGFALLRMFQARSAQARRPAMAGMPAGWDGSGRDGGSTSRFEGLQTLDAQRNAGVQPGGAMPAAAAAAATAGASWRIPAEMDVDAFLDNARKQFVRLQQVFDAGDMDKLREFTTEDVYAELAREVGERAAADNVTEVVTLQAELLGVESDADEHMASVRFTGFVRESADAVPTEIDEVWNLVKPARGQGGWLLAGIQQLG